MLNSLSLLFKIFNVFISGTQLNPFGLTGFRTQSSRVAEEGTRVTENAVWRYL